MKKWPSVSNAEIRDTPDRNGISGDLLILTERAKLPLQKPVSYGRIKTSIGGDSDACREEQQYSS